MVQFEAECVTEQPLTLLMVPHLSGVSKCAKAISLTATLATEGHMTGVPSVLQLGDGRPAAPRLREGMEAHMRKNSKLDLGRVLTYVRYALAGGLGGVAVVNTYGLAMASVPSPHVEHYAMAIGAAALAGLAKAVHAV
jgi:hypothetical protein